MRKLDKPSYSLIDIADVITEDGDLSYTSTEEQDKYNYSEYFEVDSGVTVYNWCGANFSEQPHIDIRACSNEHDKSNVIMHKAEENKHQNGHNHVRVNNDELFE